MDETKAAQVVKVGVVESFSTPGTQYTVARIGEKKSDGGLGVVWMCSCPSWQHTPPRVTGTKVPCKHLLLVFKIGHVKKTTPVVTLTAAGMALLGLPVEPKAKKTPKTKGK